MKRGLALTIALLMLFAFSACQSTPDEDFIVKKDTERMVEQAGAQEDGTLISALGIPQGRYVYETTDTSGRVQIHVDAEIMLPEVDRLPIVRIGMGGFTERDVENLYNLLCADATPIAPDAPLPKSYYAETLRKLTDMRQAGKLDMKYSSVEELDAAIAEVMKEVDQAPESVQYTAPNFALISEDGYSEARILSISENSAVSDLLVLNAQDGIGTSRAEYLRDIQDRAAYSALIAGGLAPTLAFEMTLSPYFVPPQISEQQALEIATLTVEKLGLEDFNCTGKRMAALYNQMVDASDAERRGLYEFMFTRSVNGAALTFTNDEGTARPNDPNDTAKPWMYERLRIFIDDKGIFALQWNSPYAVKEIQNDSATLLPFDKIMEIFERMIVVKNEQSGDAASISGVQIIEINEIRLGLMRVTEKNVGESGVLVPVWDFFGTQALGGVRIGLDGYQSLLTINAVDGSIIDRNFGY